MREISRIACVVLDLRLFFLCLHPLCPHRPLPGDMLLPPGFWLGAAGKW